MPMHAWKRVPAGVFHDFHNSWITHLKEALNAGCLPDGYYALGEQRASDFGPDVLTLHAGEDSPRDEFSGGVGLLAVAEAPPQVRWSQQAEDVAFYLVKQRTLVIRHVSGDRVVAMIEIVSPANKHSRETLDDLVEKVVAAIQEGVHVLVIDPLPPTRNDLDGIHGLIWERAHAGQYTAPDDLPLTLVSYCVTSPLTCYVEPLKVGDALTAMPLFLTPTHYASVPLEATYQQAWSGMPQRWRRTLETP